MKRSFFLLVIMIAFTASAQQSEDFTPQLRFTPPDEYINLPDSMIRFDSDGNKTNKTYYHKTEDGLGVIEEESIWDDVSDDWNKQRRIIKRNDIYGNEVYREESNWDGSQWIALNKLIQEYNEQGYSLLYEYYSWDLDLNDWVGSNKNVVAFDSESRITLQSNYSWDYTNRKWIGLNKQVSEYDALGNQTYLEFSQWDLEKDDWSTISIGKEEYLPGTSTLLSREYYYLNYETGALSLSNREESILDEKGRLKETLFYYAGIPGSDLILSDKQSYFYDERDRLIRREHSTKNADNEWMASIKYEYSMDDDDRLLEMLTSRWSNNNWVFFDKNTHAYYSLNGVDVDESLSCSWNTSTNEWANVTRHLTGKDSFGNTVLYDSYTWNKSLNRWNGVYHYSTEYNAANRQVLNIYYKWNNTTGVWVGDFKSVLTYLNDTILQRTEYYNWNIAASKWVGRDLYEYVYNSSGNTTQFIRSEWNTLTDDWVYKNKSETVYDENQKILTLFLSFWNQSASIWVGTSKQENQYDEQGRITRSDFYSQNEDVFYLGNSDVYYYSSFAISEDNLHFKSGGGTLSTDIIANTQWKITNYPEWLTLVPAFGNGDGTVAFIATANTSAQVRTATVEVTSASVTIPAPLFITITQDARVTPPPVSVDYTVSVLPVKGATTNPAVGSYKVRKGDSFRLDIVVSNGYDASEIALRINNEVIHSLTQTSVTNSFSYTISNIASDMEIEIIGLKYSSMVGNQDVDNDTKVYTSGNNLYIDVPAQTNTAVHTIIGQTVVNKKIPAGITSFFLPTGVYVVAVGQKVSKVIIR